MAFTGLEDDNKRFLFLTTLLKGLPRFGYNTYICHLERFPFLSVNQDVVPLSCLLCLLVRDKEVVTATPMAPVGKEFDLVICCDSSVDSKSENQRISEVTSQNVMEGLVYPTSHEAVQKMFLDHREMVWQDHANLVLHLVKLADPTNWEWLARYLLLANAKHTSDVLESQMDWAQVFRTLAFTELDEKYADLIKYNTFPYPSKTGLGLFFAEAEIIAIQELLSIIGEANPDNEQTPCVDGQSLKEFLDTPQSGTSSARDKKLLYQLLLATHHVFRASLDLISSAYKQLLGDPRCVSQIYGLITSINFAFDRLLQGKFLHWMIVTVSTDEIGQLYGEIIDPNDESTRIEVEQGPQIIGVRPRVLEGAWDECWFWLHGCFDITRNLSQVMQTPEMRMLSNWTFLDVSPAVLAHSVTRGFAIGEGWESAILELRKVYMDEGNCPDLANSRKVISQQTTPESVSKPEEHAISLLGFHSHIGTPGFQWVKERECVVHPELHLEVILATLHFAAKMELPVDPELKEVVERFKGAIPIIGTSRPCCFTCREIIFGLSQALRQNGHDVISLAWTHAIGSPGTFPDVVPENVRDSVLKRLSWKVSKLLHGAVEWAPSGAHQPLVKYRREQLQALSATLGK